MTKQDLVKTLLLCNNNKVFMSKNKARMILGLRKSFADEFLSQLPPVRGPRKSFVYFVDDIADLVMKRGLLTPSYIAEVEKKGRQFDEQNGL